MFILRWIHRMRTLPYSTVRHETAKRERWLVPASAGPFSAARRHSQAGQLPVTCQEQEFSSSGRTDHPGLLNGWRVQ